MSKSRRARRRQRQRLAVAAATGPGDQAATVAVAADSASRATQALIDLAQLRRNLRAIGAHIGPEVQLCLAVKADGYGHGAVAVARAAQQVGVGTFGVATVEEGLQLRAAGIERPILLFSLPLPRELPELVAAGLTPFCADTALGRDLSAAATAAGRQLDVHLKIDTGMGRIGCSLREAPAVAAALRQLPGLRLTGVATHFPAADHADQEHTRVQLAAFRRVADQLSAGGPLLRHAANSGAIVGLADAQLDMVRPGIIAYGYYPSAAQARVLEVAPVMELATQLVYLKRVPAGSTVSYGMTYRTASETVIGTLPVGYGDGYPRGLSGTSQVLINGQRYPVVGAICMDQCMVDLGPQPACALYDRAVLFGPDPRGPSAEELADLLGTIAYEITCGVAARVPRVYVNSGGPPPPTGPVRPAAGP